MRETNLYNGKAATRNLKSCPLCGAINSNLSDNCFCCGWSGKFDTSSEAIGSGLDELIVSCPEIANLIEAPTAKLTLKDRLRHWLGLLSR